MTKTQILRIKCDVIILRDTKINGKTMHEYLPMQSYGAEVKFIVNCLFF
jgi:hypothetical protein